MHGIDPWEAAVARAQSKVKFGYLKNIHVVAGDASKTSYADETFDLIVSNLGINNFENRAKVISERQRIVKVSGNPQAITTNLFGHMRQFYEIYRQTLVQVNKREFVSKLHAEEAHRTTVNSAKQLFENGGFVCTKTLRAPFRCAMRAGQRCLTTISRN